MAGSYTIDASIFLSAFNAGEAGYTESRVLFERVHAAGLTLIEPMLLLPEVAASVARTWDNMMLARAVTDAVGNLPYVTLIPLDLALGQIAASVAARHRLRGSDAVYAAVALQHGTTLVSLDRQHLTRLSALLTVRTPAQVLAEWPL